MRYYYLRILRALLLAALSLCMSSAWAADSGMTPLTTTSTDGKTYTARFAAGLSRNNGQSFGTTAPTGVNVLIQASISPDPAHIGMKGDLFVVERIGNQFTMRNSAGTFVPWNTKVADLIPAVEDVTLTASHTVEVFKGSINLAGDHRIFLGYLPASGAGLIFTPVPLRLEISVNADPLSIFEGSIFDRIVLSKCTLCHVKGGVADGRTTLLFLKDANLSRQNFDLFKAFFNTKSNAYDYVLSKVSGGDRHVGGMQLPNGSNDYVSMANFLAALEGRTPAAPTLNSEGSFFNGVTMQSNLKTLRRAAIMLAGRAPTAVEMSAVASGSDATLRTTLRNLMQGANFHDFVKDAANDRLLVRGLAANIVVGACAFCYPNYVSRSYELTKEAYNTGKSALPGNYSNQLDYGSEEAPLELIASVVENDQPYSEILTADYMMMNPVINHAVIGTASFATGAHTEFRPGRITGYYRQDNSVVSRNETLFNFAILLDPGRLRTNYPHVGILNDPAFLARYPSTATNRNRARARWTFFHFLGVDIEQSAQRTTDPVALADTNNPTMNNPNCTVCHAAMDPVAGTFQDYGDGGSYKISFGGMDSLDNFYKFPENGASTLYRQGDTWYRDMRVPGFNQQSADASPNSLRWLAQQIVADERFASAAVRFWWAAVIGRDLLKRPEVATDTDYQARLMAFDAQEATIMTLATNFRQSGYNAKSLFVDLLMSEWFRAERVDPAKLTAVQDQAHQIAGFGNEKLLTPEQLARKTEALTGFNWIEDINTYQLGIRTPGLVRDYGLYYGGIDSLGITRRARDMTPLMNATALTHALETSCPIVFGEFAVPDAGRKLFAGITEMVTPLTEVSIQQSITSVDENDFKPFTLSSELEPGAKRVEISFLNDYCDYDAVNNRCRTDRNVYIDGFTLRRPNGTLTIIPGSQITIKGQGCEGQFGNSRPVLWSNCTATYNFTAEQAGTYTLTAVLSASRSGTELALASIGVTAEALPTQSTARGATMIKQKLVELHRIFLDQRDLTADSPEILATYKLLTETWQAKVAANGPRHLLFRPALSCLWHYDMDFLATAGYPGNALELITEASGNQAYRYSNNLQHSWFELHGADPFYMKQSWQVVLIYLMSHYNYLYE